MLWKCWLHLQVECKAQEIPEVQASFSSRIGCIGKWGVRSKG